MSSLDDGYETNAGRTYKLLCESDPDMSLYYEAGVQWRGLRSAPDVMMGRGINRQIRRAYGFLASRYRPGDRIFLLGYSRGAFAVRSLAGVIDRVGLLTAAHSEERHIRTIYRIYESGEGRADHEHFVAEHCHKSAPIEMVGVWDTVKALGNGLPVFWRWSAPKHAFHNHDLGRSIRHGFHALARDETRNSYTMLERMESCGLVFPEDWRARFTQNPRAASVSTWRGFGKLFLLRKRRRIDTDICERIHHSVYAREQRDPPTLNGGLIVRLKRRWRGASSV